MGKLRPRKIHPPGQGHTVMKWWDHEFGFRKSSFGAIPFASKFYYPQTNRGQLFPEDQVFELHGHTPLDSRWRYSSCCDLKWVSFSEQRWWSMSIVTWTQHTRVLREVGLWDSHLPQWSQLVEKQRDKMGWGRGDSIRYFWSREDICSPRDTKTVTSSSLASSSSSSLSFTFCFWF